MCHPEIFHTNHQCHVKDSKSNAEFRNNLSAIHAKCSLTFESLPTTHLGLDQRMWQQTQNTCWLKILSLQCIPPPSTAGYFWKVSLHQFLIFSFHFRQEMSMVGASPARCSLSPLHRRTFRVSSHPLQPQHLLMQQKLSSVFLERHTV